MGGANTKRVILGLVLGLLFILVSNVSAVVYIDNCTTLDQENTIYVLTANIPEHSGDCFNIAANNVTLDCSGRNMPGVWFVGNAVYVNDYNDITIKNCNIYWYGNAIYANSVNNLNIINCATGDNNLGVGIASSNNVVVEGLNTQYNNDGLQVSGSENVTISNSIISYNSRRGIHLSDTNNTILNNLVINDNFGYGDYGIYAYLCNNCEITDSTINDNNNGIGLVDSEGFYIQDNYLRSEGNVLYLGGDSNYNHIWNNTLDTGGVNDQGTGNVYCMDGVGNEYVNGASYSGPDPDCGSCECPPTPTVVEIYDCRPLDVPNTIYLLKTDITDHSGACFTMDANNVTLDCEGHTIDGSDPRIRYHAIYNDHYDYLTVKNCSITDFRYGIYLGGSDVVIENVNVSGDFDYTQGIYGKYLDNLSVYNYRASDLNRGIYVLYSENIEIKNSAFYDSHYGVIAYYVNNTIIESSKAYNCSSDAFDISFSNNGTVKDSIVHNSSTGVFISNSDNVDVDNFTTYDNRDSGIYLVYSNNSDILNSYVYDVDYGLLTAGISYSNFENVSVRNSGYADFIISSRDSRETCKNRFVNVTGTGNKPVVYYNGTTMNISNWDNNFSTLILCDADNSVISNITYGGTPNYMGYFSHADNVQVSNITAHDCRQGVAIKYSNNAVIRDVSCSNTEYCVSSSSDNNSDFSNIYAENVEYSAFGGFYGTFSLSDSIFRNTGIYGQGAIYLSSTLNYPKVEGTIDNVSVYNSTIGINIYQKARITVNNSIINGRDHSVYTDERHSVSEGEDILIDFYDSVLNGSITFDCTYYRPDRGYYCNESNVANLYNTTFTDYFVNWTNSQLNVHWDLDVYNPLGADVTVKNVTNDTVSTFSDLSKSLWLREFYVTPLNVRTDSSPHTIEATKSGYEDLVTGITMGDNKEITLELEPAPPNVVYIDRCQGLHQENTVYVLNTSILNHSDNCFHIGANNIILDCDGYLVDGIGNHFGITSYFRNNTKIYNCNLTDWLFGIRLGRTSFYTYNYTLENISLSNIERRGISAGYIYHLTVNNVSVSNSSTGIYCESVKNSTFVNSEAEKCSRCGIYLNFYNDYNRLENLKFTGNGEKSGADISLRESDKNILENIEIENSDSIVTSNSNENLFSKLNIHNTSSGISLRGNGNLVENSNINNTTYLGVSITGENNTIKDTVISETEDYYNIYFSPSSKTYCATTDIINVTGVLFYKNRPVEIENLNSTSQIILCNASDSVINDITIEDYGLCLYWSDNLNVRNSFFNNGHYQQHPFRYGVYGYGSNNLNITDSFFNNTRLSCSKCDNLAINNITSYESLVGHFVGSSNNIEINNSNIRGQYLTLRYSKGTLSKNHIYAENTTHGIRLISSIIDIYDSNITGNNSAINLDNSRGNNLINIYNSELNRISSEVDYGSIHLGCTYYRPDMGYYCNDSSVANLYNTTFTDYFVNWTNSQLNVHWDLDVNNPLGAGVNIKDLENNTISSFSDLSKSLWLREFYVTPLNFRTNSTPHTIEATKEGYWDLTTDITMDTNKEITLTLTPLDKPDLTFVNWMQLTNENPMENESIDVTVTVKNIGNETSNETVVEFYDNDQLFATRSVGSLDPNEPQTIVQSFSSSVEGLHFIRAVVDPENLVEEWSEDNNEIIRVVYVGEITEIGNIIVDGCLSPDKGNRGASIRVHGSATYNTTFGNGTTVKGAEVTISLLENEWTTRTSSNGYFSRYIQIPMEAPIGINNVTVSVTDFTLTGQKTLDLNVTPPPPPPPNQTDLAISTSDISIVPSRLVEGENATLYVRVRNVGTNDTYDVRVDIYKDGEIFASENVPYIAWGSSQTLSFLLEDLNRSWFNIRVVLDGENEIKESNENNNMAERDFYVYGSDEIDLIVVDIWPYKTPFVGEDNTLYVKILNYGEENASNITVKVSDGPEKLGNVTIENLSRLESKTINVPWTPLYGGWHLIKAEIMEFFNESKEIFQHNNIRAENIYVYSTAPDLRILSEDIYFSEENPEPGETITIYVDVTNIGDAGASEFKVVVYEDFTEYTVELGNGTIDSLAIGQRKTISVNYSTNLSGSHVIMAEADPYGELIERYLHNNKATRALVVIWPCIDEDGDGYGVCPNCNVTNDCTYDGNDCNDTDPNINPGAAEVCNGIDDNCNNLTDEDLVRECGEGVCDGTQTCSGGEWSDCSSYGSDAGVCAICDPGGTPVYDGTQDNDCEATVCPEDGCGVDTCGMNIWGDYPDYVPNECSSIYACTQNTCDGEAVCGPDNDSDGWSPECGDCDDYYKLTYPGAPEICDGRDNDCDNQTDEGYLEVEAVLHRVGGGNRPGAGKEPIAGMEVRAFNKSEGSCAHNTGTSWQHYGDIWENCTQQQSCVTDSNGTCMMEMSDGDYIVIGEYIENSTVTYAASVVGNLSCGEERHTTLRIIKKSTGKNAPGKQTKRSGSLLYIIEPEYVLWDDETEPYPFIFESVGEWDVTVTVNPPEGFVSDHDSMSEDVNTSIEAVQFYITDIGSDWVPTEVEYEIKHKDKKEKVKTKIGVAMSKKLAKEKGLGKKEEREKKGFKELEILE